MTFWSCVDTVLFKPLELLFEVIYRVSYQMIGDPGLAIIVLSLCINFLVLPLYKSANAMQEAQTKKEASMQRGIAHIKKTFRGEERTMMLQTYYRQNNYSPTHVVRSAASLLLQIPFFTAAYRFLSGLSLLAGASLGPIADLAKPDALLTIGALSINALPILMTGINLISSAIYSKNSPAKTKIQLLVTALVFLVLLYDSPSGLVFYWTLNNVFSLGKTIVFALMGSHEDSGEKRERKGFSMRLPEGNPNPSRFRFSAIFLTLLTGALIPSAVILASPQEFVSLSNFLHPLWYVLRTMLISGGVFLLWFGVFYRLASASGKRLLEGLMMAFCVIALVDYFCFGKKLGLISSELVLDSGLHFSSKEIALNFAVVWITGVLAFALTFYKGTIARKALPVFALAFLCMSIVNSVRIADSISKLDSNMERSEDSPTITLSKSGKNVVVIMLDRAMGEYIPYIFKEKPELISQFDGFTYYSNTLSFGGHTNFATPALFGGYEYTPVEINKRSDESLVSKQNEALKVLPVLFSSKGYDVTVFDPPYANYNETPDLSIYDEYDNISAYVSKGYFSSEKTLRIISNRFRNFFCFSIMKVSPLFLQRVFYDDGLYNQCSNYYATQTINNNTKAKGTSLTFFDSYNVLCNFTNITQISDVESQSFTMISNNTTHQPTLLQTPDYVPDSDVDNTEYYQANSDCFTVDGVTLTMSEPSHYAAYCSNMAALLRLGEWFDYLREQGVYDNTRIILVSDHGFALAQLDSLVLDQEVYSQTDPDDRNLDAEFYAPLLMVKDFDSTGFEISSEFMTTADVPTLAVSNVIEDPINPFTGNEITNVEKTAHEQYVIASREFNIQSNNGNTFLPSMWLSVHDSIWDKDNWSIVAENAVLPY